MIMNNIVNRRRVYNTKPEPQDTVNVYNYTKTVPSGNYKSSSSIWFSFKTNAIYAVEATITGSVGEWSINFLGGNPTVISGNRTNWSGGKITFSFKFTSTPADRMMAYVASSSGHTVTINMTETIPHS